MSYWIKGTSTGPIAFSNVLAAILGASSTSVATAAVNSGGTGYVVGDILSVAGGTATITAQVEVVTVSAGVITAIRIFNAGSYTANPTTTANAVTGGTGSGATVDLTMSAVGWTVDRDQVWDGGSEREVIAHGSGGGSDTIYVGWRTFRNVGADYYNMELHGFTGYSSALDHMDQPGVSPGDHEAGAGQDEGCYLLLTNASFNWWVNVNSYRIIISVKVGSQYWHAYMGWGNRFGTSSEYPYPLTISAPSIFHDVNSSTSAKISSIVDPWVAGATTPACGTIIYQPGGGWEQCVNRRGSNSFNSYCVVPTMLPAGVTGSPSNPEDRFMGSNQDFGQIIFQSSTGTGGATSAVLKPTGDNSTYVMLPAIAVKSTPNPAIHLEFDECKWCNNFGGITSEDRHIDPVDGSVWRIFQNGNRTDTYAYMAIKEAS